MKEVGALVFAASLLVLGCEAKVECTGQINTDRGTFKGHSQGAVADEALKREAVKDACRSMCTSSTIEQAAANEGCTAKCKADVDGSRIGARSSCVDLK